MPQWIFPAQARTREQPLARPSMTVHSLPACSGEPEAYGPAERGASTAAALPSSVAQQHSQGAQLPFIRLNTSQSQPTMTVIGEHEQLREMEDVHSEGETGAHRDRQATRRRAPPRPAPGLTREEANLIISQVREEITDVRTAVREALQQFSLRQPPPAQPPRR